MSYPTYPAYKDSGVEWLGIVPEHWKTIRIKHLTSVRRGASPRPIDDPRYFDDEGEFAWVRIADVSASERYLEKTTQRLSITGQNLSVKMQPGNLFLSIAGTVGKPIISKIKCCIHDGFVYFPDFKENTEFLYYIFASGQPYLGLGKMGTQLNLNTDTVGSIVFGLPSLSEQEAIARFLDYKTAQIDSLIAKKETLLAKLAEKRTALISHAVTKGLDPSVPMKDSGVKWIGNIPNYWQIQRVKNIAKLESGHTPSKQVPEYWDNCDISWVSLNDSKQLAVSDYITDTAIQINKLGLANSSARLLPEGAVVFTRDATIGLAAITTKPMAVSQHLIAWLPGSSVNCLYLLRIFNAMKPFLDSYTFGATIKTIGMPDIRKLVTPVPPVHEQVAITEYLEIKLASIDKQTEQVRNALVLLHEYRSALITNAVTGKIDVRNFSIPGEVPHA